MEIKKKVKELKSLVVLASGEEKRKLNLDGKIKARIEYYEDVTQRQENLRRAVHADAAVQATVNEDEILSIDISKARMRYKKEKLNKENLDQLVAITWPDTAYENTELKEGNPLVTERYVDLAIVTKPDERKMDKGILKQFAERYPELMDLNEENQIDFITQTVKSKTEQKETLYKINIENTSSQVVISTFEKLVKHIIKTKGCKKIAIPRIQNLELY